MADAKYTKGPWTMPEVGDKVWAKELSIDEPQIWVDYDDVDREEAEANCRLVVCAPEMAKMLLTIFSTGQGISRTEMRDLLKKAGVL